MKALIKLHLICFVIIHFSCIEAKFHKKEKDISNALNVSIIPKPNFLLVKNINSGLKTQNLTTILHDGKSLNKSTSKLLEGYIALFHKKNILIDKINKQSITKRNTITLTSESNNSLSEKYKLKIEGNRIEINAESPRGVFYGVQTLRQLMNHFRGELPEIRIIDGPRFKYRGMHLDVSRHFFPVEFIKKYIDILAIHKFNFFHWHLTDDQGWRVEIKKYPRLTSVGGTRKETLIGHGLESLRNGKPFTYDSKPVSGYYSQKEIKEVVEYASKRFITIVPEIEMPGHASAAIAAYPFLSCTPDVPKEVATRWGVFEDIFCPSDTTFSFLENIISEIADIFPGPYIHIGGDECLKTAWEKSAFCQNLMKQNNIQDELELQSYFIRRVEKMVKAKGKTIIGWDEILEGGLAPNAIVMSWRGKEGGVEAAKQAHQVIMTPNPHLYFDHYQDTTNNSKNEPFAIGGFTDVKEVYEYEPIPKELSKEQQKFILGAQANLWTEYIKTPEHAEYMLLPRATALSEVLWSREKDKNWLDFKKRVINMLNLFDSYSFNYAKHILK